MARDNNGIDKPRFIETLDTDAVTGNVRWSLPKSLWISSMYLGAAIAITSYFSLFNLAAFLLTTASVLCLGHSLGMHRKLIHNSFDCPLWLEYTMVYLGTLVGLGGPLTMIYTHDIRDWAQRKPQCHDYFAHRQPFLTDAWWQMHCDVVLEQPPTLALEERLKNNGFYQ